MSHPTSLSKMEGVRAYGEPREQNVFIAERGNEKRPVVVAFNQGGYDQTWVDLGDLLQWVKKNRPELLKNE